MQIQVRIKRGSFIFFLDGGGKDELRIEKNDKKYLTK